MQVKNPVQAPMFAGRNKVSHPELKGNEVALVISAYAHVDDWNKVLTSRDIQHCVVEDVLPHEGKNVHWEKVDADAPEDTDQVDILELYNTRTKMRKRILTGSYVDKEGRIVEINNKGEDGHPIRIERGYRLPRTTASVEVMDFSGLVGLARNLHERHMEDRRFIEKLKNQMVDITDAVKRFAEKGRIF